MDEKTLKKLQEIELDILLAVDNVCCENGIHYFLDSGTLLGAARHKGFIPWDDDVDIGMLRADYERFLDIGQSVLGSEYYVQTRKTDSDVPISFAKVRKNGTLYLEKAAAGRSMHNGIWIDIFPFDVVEDNPKNLKKKEVAWRVRRKMLALRVVDEAATGASVPKRVIRKVVRAPLLLKREEAYYRAIEDLVDEGVPEDKCVLTCFHYFSKLPFLRWDDVFPLTELEFEGHMLPVFNNWEKYLYDVYGDWRQLPPVEKRVPHDALELRFEV